MKPDPVTQNLEEQAREIIAPVLHILEEQLSEEDIARYQNAVHIKLLRIFQDTVEACTIIAVADEGIANAEEEVRP